VTANVYFFRPEELHGKEGLLHEGNQSE